MDYEEALREAYQIVEEYERELFNNYFIGFARGKEFLAKQIADKLMKYFEYGRHD